MRSFPAQIKIKVFDNTSKRGVAGIAVKLTLFAPRKNNYVIPMVTNSTGEIFLSGDYVRQSINDDWKLFPMDYVSPLEECSADVELKVCTTEDVKRTLEAFRMFRSASTISDALIQAFEHCVNDQYLPGSQRFNVEETNELAIGIFSRAAAPLVSDGER